MFAFPVKKKLSKSKILRPSDFLILIISNSLILVLISIISMKFHDYFVNKNMIFGLFFDNNLAMVISFFLIIFFVIITLVYRFYHIGLVFILSGAIANLASRLAYGGVIDYADLPLIKSFNLADVVIIIGFLALVRTIIQDKAKRPPETL